MSLDGYIADAEGNFSWGEPDEEVHNFIRELIRPFGTYLYGRRLYDAMVVWETWPRPGEEPQYVHDFAEVWRAADKIVYSRTLETVSSTRTHIERSFDPEQVRR